MAWGGLVCFLACASFSNRFGDVLQVLSGDSLFVFDPLSACFLDNRDVSTSPATTGMQQSSSNSSIPVATKRMGTGADTNTLGKIGSGVGVGVGVGVGAGRAYVFVGSDLGARFPDQFAPFVVWQPTYCSTFPRV
jgi:hypothetical protein